MPSTRMLASRKTLVSVVSSSTIGHSTCHTIEELQLNSLSNRSSFEQFNHGACQKDITCTECHNEESNCV